MGLMMYFESMSGRDEGSVLSMEMRRSPICPTGGEGHSTIMSYQVVYSESRVKDSIDCLHFSHLR